MSQSPTSVITGGDSNRFAQQLQELQDQFAFHLGPAYGGVQMNTPHTNMLFPYREVHGPTKTSVDATHNTTFIVDFDETVAWLHQAKLTVRMSAVRSNVSGAASGGSSAPTTSSGGSQTPTSGNGGAQTSSSGGSQTPTSGNGGAQTSSSGGSQTPTSASGGAHGHKMFGHDAGAVTPTTKVAFTGTTVADHRHELQSDGSDTGPMFNAKDSAAVDVHLIWAYVANVGASDFTNGLYTYQDSSTHAHDVTVAAHTHTVADHTHGVTVAAHDHTVNVAAHAHSNTYGIYEGSAPSTPAVTVTINGTDRTTALGGPWNAGFTVDVTQYLREASGDPLRQANTIVFTSAELIDLEVVCKSFVSAASPFAAGVSRM